MHKTRSCAHILRKEWVRGAMAGIGKFAGPLLSGERISASEEADHDWRVAVEGTRNLELLHMLCPKLS